MSLDIWLIDIIETTVVDKNITHNLNTLWEHAGVYDALYNSEGKKAKDVLPILEKGLKLLKENPVHFKRFSAPNGWGTYEQAVPWLVELIDEFKAYPQGVIDISK